MSTGKINIHKMLAMVDEGCSQAEIAKAFGVSRQAVHKELSKVRGKTTNVVVAKKVEQIVDRKIDAMEQLQKVNDYANELLDLLMRWNRGDEEALQILESQVRKVRVRGSEEEVTNYKFKDPRELALKAMAEIRGQLSLQLDIFQALFSLQAAKDFEETVLEVIGEVDPNVRNEIISRLNRKRSVRQAVRFT
jgi:predicted transcriptional regulator